VSRTEDVEDDDGVMIWLMLLLSFFNCSID